MKMKLRIIALPPPVGEENAKNLQEIEVNLQPTTSLENVNKLLEFEQWLNTHTRSRFHISVE